MCGGNGSNETDADYYDASAWFVFIAYWELCVCMVGAPLNLLVIFVWSSLAWKKSSGGRHAQSRNRWFILSMTCGDLLFTCIHAPLFFLWYNSLVDMDDGLCLLVYGVTHLSTTVSSISLLLLNIDKFIYLHWPLHYTSIMTNGRARVMAVCGWGVAFTWAMLFLFGSFVERQAYCSLVIKQRMFYAFFLVIFFLMPILLSTATSIYIAVVAVRARLAETASTRIVTTVVDPLSLDEDSGGGAGPLRKKTSGMRVELAHAAAAAAVVPWRTITFVFTTTIWCTLTYLPYRVSLCVSTITAQGGHWLLILFAVMVTYAAGNPIITIVTQPIYRKRVAEIFRFGKVIHEPATFYSSS